MGNVTFTTCMQNLIAPCWTKLLANLGCYVQILLQITSCNPMIADFFITRGIFLLQIFRNANFHKLP